MKSKKNENNTSLRNNYTSLRKHNNLIQSEYYLEASEQKFLYKIFEEIQQKDFKTPLVKINFKDFFRDFKGVLGKNITKKDFLKLIDSLQSKRVFILNPDGEFAYTHWYVILGNLNDTNEITLEIDSRVFPYIEGLKGNFTWLKLSSIYSFKSFYTMRLYELLRQWFDSKPSIEFELDTLKSLLGIENQKSYSNYANFNKYVVEKAVKEINKKSELTIEYKPIKKGRKIVAIIFTKLEDELKVKNSEKPNKTYKNTEPDTFSGITVSGNLYDVLTEVEARKQKDSSNIIEGDVIEEDGVLKAKVSEASNIRNNKATIKTYSEDSKKEAMYIPEGLNMSEKIKYDIFAEQFKDYNFSNIDYKFALLEAEYLTLSKDNSKMITVKNYKLFTTILNKKLDELEKVLNQKEAEERDNKYWNLLTEEQQAEAYAYGDTAEEYYKKINNINE